MFDSLSFLFSLLPYAGYILCFLFGCWFYRWMLKRNPAMLETLVDQVNNTGKYAKNALDKVGAMVSEDKKPKV